MNGTCNSTIYCPPLWGLGEGPKGQISLKVSNGAKIRNRYNQVQSINLNYNVNFKEFKPFFVCLLTKEIYKKILDGIFIESVHWVMPRVLGCWDQKLNFLNMVMWPIKLKGMGNRPEYTEKFYPSIKLVTLGWGQRVKYN